MNSQIKQAPLTAAQRKAAQVKRDKEKIGIDAYRKMKAEEMKIYRAKVKANNIELKAKLQALEAAAKPAPKQKAALQPTPPAARKSTRNTAQQVAPIILPIQAANLAPQKLVKVKKIKTAPIIPLYKKANATALSPNSVDTYINQFKQVYILMTGEAFDTKIDNELVKVLKLSNYNKSFINKKLSFVKDTDKLITDVKLKAKTDNTYKAWINSIVAIISRIPSFNKEYQILTNLSTQLSIDYNTIRNNNTVSAEDNKKIFNFEPSNIQRILNTITNIKDRAIFGCYALQPPRRVEDFSEMILTNETDSNKLTNPNLNSLVIVDNKPLQFIYNNYKTSASFGVQIINIQPQLSEILQEYIKNKKIKIGEYLFGVDKDRRQPTTNFSKNVTTTFSKYIGEKGIGAKWIRVSYATYLNTLQLSISQREEYALKMAHSVSQNMQYAKNVISVDSFLNEDE